LLHEYVCEFDTKFNAAVIQMACSTDPADNLQRGVEHVRARRTRRGRHLPAGVVSFAILLSTRGHRLLRTRRIVAWRNDGRARKVSGELNVVIVAPVFERRAPGLYHNSVAIIDNGTIAGVYRKMHIPTTLVLREILFHSGDLGFTAFDTSAGRIASLICWTSVSGSARLAALHGAILLFYPTAIGWHPARRNNTQAQRDACRRCNETRHR